VLDAYKTLRRSLCLLLSSSANVWTSSPRMPFLQPPATITLSSVFSMFAHLRRKFNARLIIFKSGMPSLPTVKGKTSVSKQKSSFVSAGTKCRSFLPSQKLSSSSSFSSRSSGESSSSYSSTIDTSLVPSSPVCGSGLLVPPPVGTKITDRFWPEENSEHSGPAELSISGGSVMSGMVNVLSPPPYHRRAPSTVVQQDNVESSDNYPPHCRDRDDSRPLKFPF